MKYEGRCIFCNSEISELMYEQNGGICQDCDFHFGLHGNKYRTGDLEGGSLSEMGIINRYVKLCLKFIRFIIDNNIDFVLIGNDLKVPSSRISYTILEGIDFPFLYKLFLYYNLKENWLE